MWRIRRWNMSLMDQTCPIWSTPSAIGTVGGRLDLTSVNSPRARANMLSKILPKINYPL